MTSFRDWCLLFNPSLTMTLESSGIPNCCFEHVSHLLCFWAPRAAPLLAFQRRMTMDVVIERCAGIDIGKKLIVAAVRTPGAGRSGRVCEVRSFGGFARNLEALADWLEAEGVTHVAMEATGVYWKPVWHVLEEHSFELMLVNPTQVRKIPGRKTDVIDAQWIGQLLECGLLHGSFVSPEQVRDLRDLTRYRKRLVQDRAR